MDQPLRLTSVMGVARALLATVAVDDAVEILLSEFGFDASLQALSLLRGDDAASAFAACWTSLLTDEIRFQLRN